MVLSGGSVNLASSWSSKPITSRSSEPGVLRRFKSAWAIRSDAQNTASMSDAAQQRLHGESARVDAEVGLVQAGSNRSPHHFVRELDARGHPSGWPPIIAWFSAAFRKVVECLTDAVGVLDRHLEVPLRQLERGRGPHRTIGDDTLFKPSAIGSSR